MGKKKEAKKLKKAMQEKCAFIAPLLAAGARAVPAAMGAARAAAPMLGKAFAGAAGTQAAKSIGGALTQKQGAIIHPAIDLAGLAMLGKRPLDHLLHSDDEEAKRDARWELAGLGVLAAPAAHDVGKGLYDILQRHKLSAFTR